MTELWLIDMGYACYGIVMVNNRVTVVPPIARWMLGKHYDTVRGWVLGHAGSMTVVERVVTL